jgi:hypothetical protein
MSKLVNKTASKLSHIGRDACKFQFDIIIHEISVMGERSEKYKHKGGCPPPLSVLTRIASQVASHPNAPPLVLLQDLSVIDEAAMKLVLNVLDAQISTHKTTINKDLETLDQLPFDSLRDRTALIVRMNEKRILLALRANVFGILAQFSLYDNSGTQIG